MIDFTDLLIINAILSSLHSYSERKTLLKRSEPDNNTENFFTYKRKKYDFDVYVSEKADMIKKQLINSEDLEIQKADALATIKAISEIDN